MKEPIYIKLKKGKVNKTLEFHRIVDRIKTKSMIFLDMNIKNELLGIEIIGYDSFTPAYSEKEVLVKPKKNK